MAAALPSTNVQSKKCSCRRSGRTFEARRACTAVPLRTNTCTHSK